MAIIIFKKIRRIFEMIARIDEKIENVMSKLKSFKLFSERENLIVSANALVPCPCKKY